MASEFLHHLGHRVAAGLVVVPSGTNAPFNTRTNIDVIEAGHPTPDEGSERAGRRALALAAGTPAEACLVVLLSGGASALVAAPADGVTLEEKRTVTRELLRAGADICALNTVRKHLSIVKGGRLAADCRAPVVTLAISDVVGDDPSAIASGPTVPDPTSFSDALTALRDHGVQDRIPAAVLRHLEAGTRGERAESPKPGDSRLRRSRFHLIGSARNAIEGAAGAAGSLGYSVHVHATAVVGEARDAALAHLETAARILHDLPRPACILSSGETTVTVSGTGRGGRNQEFALASAPLMRSLGEVAAIASLGTDGIDGPTDAAGAIADTTTVERARHAGLRPLSDYLDNNDAYTCFSALGDLVRTGPTGTNVGDIQVILVA